MTLAVKASEINALSCPLCGANWHEIRKALAELPVETIVDCPTGIGGCVVKVTRLVPTESYLLARAAIRSCPECRREFGATK